MFDIRRSSGVDGTTQCQALKSNLLPHCPTALVIFTDLITHLHVRYLQAYFSLALREIQADLRTALTSLQGKAPALPLPRRFASRAPRPADTPTGEAPRTEHRV